MAYEKQTFVDNETVLSASHLTHIENGISAVEAAVANAQSKLDLINARLSKIDIQPIDFGESWFNGATASTLKPFPHGLEKAPKFVAIYADNIDAARNATPTGNITAAILQSDRLAILDSDGGIVSYLACTYLRHESGTTTAANLAIDNRLIAKWDNTHVYVNSAAGAYAWPPNTVTSFTMICVA